MAKKSKLDQWTLSHQMSETNEFKKDKMAKESQNGIELYQEDVWDTNVFKTFYEKDENTRKSTHI